jgi:hypothetical protein
VAVLDPGAQLDIQPGISAVVFAQPGQAEFDATVLDLAAVLDGLVFDNFEIVVVEAMPSPCTADLIAELRVRFPRLPLRPLGGHYADQAAALSAAFGAAAYDLIFVTSADGQYDVRELNHLLEAIEHGADLVIGYRPNRADSFARRLDGWGWNLLINLVFGRTARDVNCAFKLFRQNVWQRVDMRSRGTATFYTELLVRARRLGFRVTEVPVKHRRATDGLTGAMASPAAIWRALADLNGVRNRADVDYSTTRSLRRRRCSTSHLGGRPRRGPSSSHSSGSVRRSTIST